MATSRTPFFVKSEYIHMRPVRCLVNVCQASSRRRFIHTSICRRYQLNAAIAISPKPQVSIWDGFCMGGGAGISVHGKFRIATEKTVFAMPETNIGLFPDVGASHFLSSMPGGLGTYLSLTGARLGAADLLYTGLATHYIPSSSIPSLLSKLELCDGAAHVEEACAMLAEDAGAPPLAMVRPQIDHCFRHDSVENILTELRAMDSSEWAEGTLKTLEKMSPTSCKVTILGCAISETAESQPQRHLFNTFYTW